MGIRRVQATPQPDRSQELRADLARKIAFFVGSAENRATPIPGLTLHRRTTLTAPCSMTYEPSVTVLAQGRKRVDLGRTTFLYGPSQTDVSIKHCASSRHVPLTNCIHSPRRPRAGT